MPPALNGDSDVSATASTKSLALPNRSLSLCESQGASVTVTGRSVIEPRAMVFLRSADPRLFDSRRSNVDKP